MQQEIAALYLLYHVHVFVLERTAVHPRASCEEPKSLFVFQKITQPPLHRSPTSLYTALTLLKKQLSGSGDGCSDWRVIYAGAQGVARAMLAKDVLPPRGTAWRVCFATGSALSGKHFGFRNSDGGYATETPTV